MADQPQNSNDQTQTNVPQSQPQQMQPQPQYIVQAKSLDGLGGWLIFWLIVFGINGISYVALFFAAIDAGGSENGSVLTMILGLPLAILFFAALATVAMQKKIGRTLSIAAIVGGGLFLAIMSVIEGNDSLALTVSSVLTIMIGAGLFSLYFVASKRVKQTLVK